jgi:hypothetical protein
VEVIEVKPKYTPKQISLREEQKQLVEKLLPLMKEDMKRLNELIDEFEYDACKEAKGYSFDVTACLNNLRQSVDEKLRFLENGGPDNQAHVNLVNNLSNKYHIDNVIR